MGVPIPFQQGLDLFKLGDGNWIGQLTTRASALFDFLDLKSNTHKNRVNK